MRTKIAMTVVILVMMSGCSIFKKKSDDSTNMKDQVSSEPMDFSIKGSDSGKIPGLQTVYFEFDKSSLADKEQKKLVANAMWLQANQSKTLLIEGHADQIGSTEYNLSLGERRANYIKRFLISLGVKSNRLNTTSYGEEKPLVTGDSEEAMAKNRRANFVPN